MEEIRRRYRSRAHPLHLFEQAHGKKIHAAPHRAGAGPDRVRRFVILSRELIGSRVKLFPDGNQTVCGICHLRNPSAVAVIVAALFQQCQNQHEILREHRVAVRRVHRNEIGQKLSERRLRVLGKAEQLDAPVLAELCRSDNFLRVSGYRGRNHQRTGRQIRKLFSDAEFCRIFQINRAAELAAKRIENTAPLNFRAADADEHQIVIAAFFDRLHNFLHFRSSCKRLGKVRAEFLYVELNHKYSSFFDAQRLVLILLLQRLYDIIHRKSTYVVLFIFDPFTLS